MTDSDIIKEFPPEGAEGAEIAIVRRLLLVLLRRAPMAEARDLLAEKLIVYVDDRLIAHGRGAWFRWVACLHDTADKKDLSEATIVVDKISNNNGEVSVEARWQIIRRGNLVFSNPGTVTYVVSNNKIEEIRTHRENYIFFYGKRIAESWIAFYWLLLQVSWYYRRVGEGRVGEDL